MKTSALQNGSSPIAVSILLYCSALVAQAQGNFQNLDFELATIVPVPGDPYGRVEFAPAFPGWTGYVGTDQQTLALYNNSFLSTAGLGIEGPGWPYSPPIIEGDYSALLQSGMGSSGTNPVVSASIAQTASIPASAKSLQIKVGVLDPIHKFEVTVGGQTISLIPLSIPENYTTLYGGDISMFASQTRELRIAAIPTAEYAFSMVMIDSIVFSDQVVPEPSTIGLFALGGLLLVRRLRRTF